MQLVHLNFSSLCEITTTVIVEIYFFNMFFFDKKNGKNLSKCIAIDWKWPTECFKVGSGENLRLEIYFLKIFFQMFFLWSMFFWFATVVPRCDSLLWCPVVALLFCPPKVLGSKSLSREPWRFRPETLETVKVSKVSGGKLLPYRVDIKL